jgi:hypothetical protein
MKYIVESQKEDKQDGFGPPDVTTMCVLCGEDPRGCKGPGPQ